MKKFKTYKFFKKKKRKKISKFSIPSKNSSFPNSKKKKKKSSLNSSTGTESYDLLPYSPVMQHQVNCPPSAFIEVVCPKLGAFARYAEFYSMNNSVTN